MVCDVLLTGQVHGIGRWIAKIPSETTHCVPRGPVSLLPAADGGNSGIGCGLAEALHKLGDRVIISGRGKCNFDVVIAASPGSTAVEFDVADPASITKVANKPIADHSG